MGAEGWWTVLVLVVTIAALVTDRFSPPVVMGVAVVTLYVTDVVSLGEAFSGFSNQAPITVAGLYVLAGAAELTGAFEGAMARVLGPRAPGSERRAVGRIVAPTAAASSLLANTPLVAMLAPQVAFWARRHGISPSRLLMPLSYASILGGVITLLGTSTNLLVNDFLIAADLEPFGVFTITRVGLPVAVVGVAVLVLVAPLLLGRRRTLADDVVELREFSVEMLVAGDAAAGRTVAEAGLRDLQGVFLVEIERGDRVVTPVAPHERLEVGDRLVFVGDVDRILDLRLLPGLATADDRHFSAADRAERQFFEAVVAASGSLAGVTVKDARFRERHGGAVVAVHRSGERRLGKIGDVVLRGGDVLLVAGQPGFAARLRGHPDFHLVAPYSGATPQRRRGRRVVEAVLAAVVLVAGAGLVDLPKATLAGVLAVLATRAIGPGDLRRMVNVDVVLMLAFSFGLGVAVASSGVADEAASLLVDVAEPIGPVAVLAAVMFATLVATELLSNNAAAAMLLPVVLAISAETGLEVRPLAVGVLIMASCSFLTPIGYQTNTMIWGLGGYRFADFSRLGAPLTLVVFLTALLVIPLGFPLE